MIETDNGMDFFVVTYKINFCESFPIWTDFRTLFEIMNCF